MALVQIVITVETSDPKSVIAGAGEKVPAEWTDLAYSIDGVWVDDEGDPM
jgi:hypothetical protein